MGLKLSDIFYEAGEFSLELPSLEIHEGSFYTLLGPSGCGKSTTLRLIAGFLTGSTGRVELSGRDITRLPPERRRIGMVFQDLALFPHLSVEGNITYGLKIQKKERGKIETRLQELLSTISLEGYRNRNIRTLSGGERQRVAIARSLAAGPDLLLLDEPLSALDARMRINLRRELKRLHREMGFTCLYVTHDQEEALSLSDRIGIMFDGQIIQSGPPEEVYHNPATPQAARFLGFSNEIEDTQRTGFVRPEQCRISDADHSGSEIPLLKIEGRILYREYTGSSYLYGLKTAEGVLQGHSLNKLPETSRYILQIPHKDIIWFER